MRSKLEWYLKVYITYFIIKYAFMYHFYAFEKHHVGLKVLSSRLKKLENLHLSGNQYNDTVFPSLTGFSSLKSLDLSFNQLTGSGIIHSFYLNASHDILLIMLFLYQEKWGRLYIKKRGTWNWGIYFILILALLSQKVL
jgi:hypothetical protein